MRNKFLIILFLLVASKAWSTTYFVLNNNDSGTGSLRQAIISANADTNEPHLISFVNFTGLTTINLGADVFPEITREIVIDATTHPSYSGTPIIGLNCEKIETPSFVLDYANSGEGSAYIFRFGVGSENSFLKGFEFYDDPLDTDPSTMILVGGFYVQGVSNITIQNNAFHDMLLGGIVSFSQDFLIEDNDCNDVLTFVRTYGETDGGTIVGNNISNIDAIGIYIRSNGLLVSENTISNSLERIGITIITNGGTEAVNFWGRGVDNHILNNSFSDLFTGISISKGFGEIDVYSGPTYLYSYYPSGANFKADHNLIESNLFDSIQVQAIDLNYDALGYGVFPGNDGKITPTVLNITTSGLIAGVAEQYDKIEVFASHGDQEAEVFLGSVTADYTGLWVYDFSAILGSYTHISVTATEPFGSQIPDHENTSEMITVVIPEEEVECSESNTCATAIPLTGCENIFSNCYDCSPMNETELWYVITVTEPGQTLSIIENAVPWDFNYAIGMEPPGVPMCLIDFSTVIIDEGEDVSSINYVFDEVGVYYLFLDGLTDCPNIDVCFSPGFDPCENCIGSFAPIPGNKYLIGAWTKEEDALNTQTEYDQPIIYIHYTIDTDPLDPYNATSTFTSPAYTPSGAIIDGWQRIEEEFTIPADAIDMKIELTTAGDDVLFDDIRVFPFNASMKTFVYDPINMRLSAELDERHYATFYEYDEEGKLVRIKKETERGVMTIQETKSNSSKQP